MRLVWGLFWLAMLSVTAASAAADASLLTSWEAGAHALSPAAAASSLVLAEAAAQAGLASVDSSALSDTELTTRVRRGRWLVSLGAAIFAGTAITYAFAERRNCDPYPDYDKTLPRVTAAVLGAGSVAMTTLGAMQLASVPGPERKRHRAAPTLRFARAMGAIGAAAVSSFLIGAGAVYGMQDSYGCINS